MPSALASPLDAVASSPLAPPPLASPPSAPDLTNYNAANTALKMNPQEQALYQMHLTNLHGPGGVDNPPDAQHPQGSRSSLYQTSVEIDGRVYNIPTVWNGKIVSPDQAVQLAQQHGLDKFPSYENEQQAQSRYDQMHDYMEKDTRAYLTNRK
jgi:hypothetical protein